ncbi:MAG: ROK family protein [Pirellulales bacterium]|nr:ROK family protein [Pirellulales bacterium]
MHLGIEIGGTKLQLGVGAAENGTLVALERVEVRPADGAEGIRRQIERIGKPLVEQFDARTIGVGFGGPVEATAGKTLKSHHVAGWDDFPLAEWCRKTFDRPAAVANDADAAGLGEARFGAGRGKRVVFYTNVGSGIGGALVIDRRIYVGGVGVASELGHLRPGPEADSPEQCVESTASGWSIAAAARRNEKLAARFDCPPERVTAKMVAEAANKGDEAAGEIFRRAVRTYGWAVAQMITLLAPDVVAVGGGVPLAGEELFFAPLREAVDRYVFPPLRGTCSIVPAALGEEVVVHGALALARGLAENGEITALFIP